MSISSMHASYVEYLFHNPGVLGHSLEHGGERVDQRLPRHEKLLRAFIAAECLAV